jgi:phage repressor protein C with HTH and peptisase S24 domain
MVNVSDMLRTERQAAGMTQDALAAAIGCSKGQLSLMESGQRTISLDRARDIERALGIMDGRLVTALNWERTPPEVRREISASIELTNRLRESARAGKGGLDALYRSGALRELVNQLESNVDDPRPLGRSIPIINKVAAGYPREFTDLGYPAAVADDYVACPEVTDLEAFAARVVGDSMEPDYREGDIVIFAPGMPTGDGSDCFVRLERDNETTFKRVYFEDDGTMIRLQPLNNRYAPRLVPREDVGGLYAAAYVMRAVASKVAPGKSKSRKVDMD